MPDCYVYLQHCIFIYLALQSRIYFYDWHIGVCHWILFSTVAASTLPRLLQAGMLLVLKDYAGGNGRSGQQFVVWELDYFAIAPQIG